MRAAFFVTITLILILTGVFYYVFYTPALVEKVVPQLFEKYLPEGNLKSFTVGRQAVEYPTMLKLFKVKVSFDYEDQPYELDIHQLDIPYFMEAWKHQENVALKVHDAQVQGPSFQVNGLTMNVQINLKANLLQSLEGTIEADRIQYDSFVFDKLQFKVQNTPKQFILKEIVALLYGGQLTGDIKATLTQPHSELVNLEFKQLNSEKLQEINKAFFNQIKGEFNGSLRLNRNEGQVQILAISADMPQGVVLSSRFGQRIADNLTDEDARYALKTILAQEGVLKFDKAEFRILNVNQDLAGVTYTFEKKDQNLRVQDTLNIEIKQIFNKVKLGLFLK